jgi:hypothetical protein
MNLSLFTQHETIVILDLEGQKPNYREICGLLVVNGILVSVFNKTIVLRGAYTTERRTYIKCHGIPPSCGTCLNVPSAIVKFLAWFDQIKMPIVIVGQGVDDIKDFVQAHVTKSNIIDILDIKLPPWAVRVNTNYFREAKIAKDNGMPLLNVSCRHHVAIHKHCNKHGSVNDTHLAKNVYGYHCALYDTYMIYLFIKGL